MNSFSSQVITKSILAILVLGLSSCAVPGEKENFYNGRTQSIERNSRCFGSNYFIISKIMEDGVIATHCPLEYRSYYKNSFEACMKSPKIFLPIRIEKNNYVDNQRVELPEDKCLEEDGVKTLNDNYHIERIRKVKIRNSIKSL